MTQSYIQTVFRLLILCLLSVGVSTQVSSPVTSYLLKGWVPNACTLVVCAPHKRGLEKGNGDQVLLVPSGVMVGDKIFKTDGSTGDYETAKILCSQMGATIALPKNAAENKAVQQIVQWQNKKAVLGATDSDKEGTFKNASGKIVTYFNWAPGEPNNLQNEDCVEMHPDGKWHDRRCGLEWIIICEF
ncbi:pulmonary surfactant-associated protein D-like [Heteronotia binoei]|uniref:pulmonary surfactant-associated protein D-like n=1 Tax=Heteronotia binoei TaxID=13085 RepID=UPI0029302825|nr:pulmonary surfactant-associated protein D-like [Heteronotia binoei]